MDLHLGGAVAVVTGAASGIGRTTAEYLRRDGARLVLADANAAALEDARAELAGAGAEVVSARRRPPLPGLRSAWSRRPSTRLGASTCW